MPSPGWKTVPIIPSHKPSLGMVTVDLVYASKEGRWGAHRRRPQWLWVQFNRLEHGLWRLPIDLGLHGARWSPEIWALRLKPERASTLKRHVLSRNALVWALCSQLDEVLELCTVILPALLYKATLCSLWTVVWFSAVSLSTDGWDCFIFTVGRFSRSRIWVLLDEAEVLSSARQDAHWVVHRCTWGLSPVLLGTCHTCAVGFSTYGSYSWIELAILSFWPLLFPSIFYDKNLLSPAVLHTLFLIHFGDLHCCCRIVLGI